MNINRKLRRRDDTITKLKEQIKVKSEIEAQLNRAKQVSKRHQVNLFNAQKQILTVVEECKSLSAHTKHLNEKALELQSALDFVGNERDC